MKVNGAKVYDGVEGRNGERLILLAWENQPQKFRNLLKIDANGQTLWTVQPVHPLEGVYTSIAFKDGQLTCYNYAGFSETIDYETGRVLGGKLVK